MAVFGSNLGWQCFFAALTFGVECDGFEIVQHRYDASVEFAKKHQVGMHAMLAMMQAVQLRRHGW